MNQPTEPSNILYGKISNKKVIFMSRFDRAGEGFYYLIDTSDCGLRIISMSKIK